MHGVIHSDDNHRPAAECDKPTAVPTGAILDIFSGHFWFTLRTDTASNLAQGLKPLRDQFGGGLMLYMVNFCPDSEYFHSVAEAAESFPDANGHIFLNVSTQTVYHNVDLCVGLYRCYLCVDL